MHQCFLWRAFGLPLPTPIFEVSNQLFLLGVHGNHWLLSLQEVLRRGVYVFELGVSVRV